MNRRVIRIVAMLIIVAGFFYIRYRDKDKKSVDQVQNEFEYFPVYGMDAQTWETEIMYYFKIKRDLSVAGKIESIAEQLSKRNYKTLPIEVSLVEKENGQTIAAVNLSENKDFDRLTWKGSYFQGSTGGAMTSTTLIKTFIQNDYKGDWIDGIVFKYEGGSLDFYDHMNQLYDTVWRASENPM